MALTMDALGHHMGQSLTLNMASLRLFAGRNKTLLFALALMASYLFLASEAMAGSSTAGKDEDTFGTVWETIQGWTQGTFGRIIALTLVLVGAAMGVVRQSLITFVVGVAMGLGLYNAPIIIDTIMGASIEDMAIMTEAGINQISNGMK